DRGVRRIGSDPDGGPRALALLPVPRRGRRRARLPAARRAAAPPRTFLRAHRRRRRRDPQRRNRPVPPACGGRVAAPVRAAPVRRPQPDGAHAFRNGVRRDDARVLPRRSAAVPRLADRPRRLPLAGVRAGPALCLRALALGPLCSRRRVVVEVGAGRLGAPVGRMSLDRRADPARRGRLAAVAGAAPARAPPPLAAGGRLRPPGAWPPPPPP